MCVCVCVCVCVYVNMIKYQSLLCLCLCLSVSVSVSASLSLSLSKCQQVNKWISEQGKKRVFLFALLLLCLYSFQSLCSLYWDFSIQRHKDTTSSPLFFSWLSLFSLSLSLSLLNSHYLKDTSYLIDSVLLACAYLNMVTYRLRGLGKSLLLLLLLSSQITDHRS